jgi:hypothetical protein
MKRTALVIHPLSDRYLRSSLPSICMNTDAAVRLFTLMAERFRGLVKFQAEAELRMNDEQYVRSVMGTALTPNAD